jgi:hypothetical protein
MVEENRMGSQAGKYWCRKGRNIAALPNGVEARLAAKLVAKGECLEFVGHRTPKGYGQIKVCGRAEYAHRIAYALWVGELQAGLTVDHTCRNCACCNPAHLRLLTVEQNVGAQFAGYAQDEATASDEAVDAMLIAAKMPWDGEDEPWL